MSDLSTIEALCSDVRALYAVGTVEAITTFEDSCRRARTYRADRTPFAVGMVVKATPRKTLGEQFFTIKKVNPKKLVTTGAHDINGKIVNPDATRGWRMPKELCTLAPEAVPHGRQDEFANAKP